MNNGYMLHTSNLLPARISNLAAGQAKNLLERSVNHSIDPFINEEYPFASSFHVPLTCPKRFGFDQIGSPSQSIIIG